MLICSYLELNEKGIWDPIQNYNRKKLIWTKLIIWMVIKDLILFCLGLLENNQSKCMWKSGVY